MKNSTVLHRLPSVLLVVILLTSGLAALTAAETDFGGTLQVYADGSNVAGQNATVGVYTGLWTDTDFTPLLRLRFSGGYMYQLDKGNDFSFPDLQRLSLSGRRDSHSYQAGRFTLRDRKNSLVQALMDGAQYTYASPRFSHTAAAGFTGLAFNRSSRVIMTAVDQRAYDNAGALSLASPRAAAFYEFTARFESNADSENPGDHTLSAALLGEADARSSSAVVADNPDSSLLHSGFFQLGVNGRFSGAMYYRVNGIFQAGGNVIPNDNRTLPVLGGLAEGSLSWNPGGSLAPTISGELLYSSGDTWSERSDWEGTQMGPGPYLHQYTGFTTRTAGYVYGSRVGNLTYLRVGASVRPVEMFSLEISNFINFRSVNGPVNEMPLTESDGSSSYLGDEIVITAAFRPWSDLGLKLNGGLFFHNRSLFNTTLAFRFGGAVTFSL